MKKAIILTSVLILVALPILVFAAEPPAVQPVPYGVEAREVLTRILNWILTITGIIAAIFFVIGGIQYITAGGDPNKVAAAKTTLTNAVIGVAVIILAYVIINLIKMILT